MSYSLWIHAFKCTANLYSISSIKSDVQTFHDQIALIYADISLADYQSAIQSFDAITTSKSPDFEIHNVISHLQNAFNVGSIGLTKTVKTRVWLFSADFALLDETERGALGFYLAHLASLVSIMYKHLDEPSNGEKWKNTAIDVYQQYLSSPCIDLEKLKNIDGTHVTEEESKEVYYGGDIFPDDVITTSYLQITQKGKEYLMKKFIETIDAIKFTLE